MSYFSWSKRPPREFRGKPQWTLDELYISPFTARRRYDEEGVMHYDPVERNLKPTGVEVMDHYLRRLTEGRDKVEAFCRIYGLRTEDLDSLIYILTGMSGADFRMAYQLRLADDLLRYTDLPLAEVARRSGHMVAYLRPALKPSRWRMVSCVSKIAIKRVPSSSPEWPSVSDFSKSARRM